MIILFALLAVFAVWVGAAVYWIRRAQKAETRILELEETLVEAEDAATRAESINEQIRGESNDARYHRLKSLLYHVQSEIKDKEGQLQAIKRIIVVERPDRS